ncbi:phage tail protein [Parabacteroides pacaensis]|uniref:phage tail protein n=1 Tax=Parabacteroides pacaensis TaxID=2086575 RepID=UPI000D0F5876|nr:phage tail protein [Parabacteroides pacaensis]
MADTTGKEQNTIWPLPSFYFKVEIGKSIISCKEVSGMDMESEVIEYRAGDNPVHSKIKMPGMKKYSNITLKKGIFKGDNQLWDWISQIKLNTFERQPVTISLLDQEGNPTMVWKLTNAFPVKITTDGLKADGNEVAIETMELAHEGITLENK